MDNNDVEPGRFFYITVTQNPEAKENALMNSSASKIYESFGEFIDDFSMITDVLSKSRTSTLHEDIEYGEREDVVESMVIQRDGKWVNRVTAWCIDRRGHLLH